MSLCPLKVPFSNRFEMSQHNISWLTLALNNIFVCTFHVKAICDVGAVIVLMIFGFFRPINPLSMSHKYNTKSLAETTMYCSSGT